MRVFFDPSGLIKAVTGQASGGETRVIERISSGAETGDAASKARDDARRESALRKGRARASVAGVGGGTPASSLSSKRATLGGT